MPLYRRLPKRGFHNPFSKDFAIINVGAIQAQWTKASLTQISGDQRSPAEFGIS